MKENIKAAMEAYSPPVRGRLLALRGLILQTAQETPGVGTIEEDLRWGQPSFLTPETGSGSTIRIDGFKDDATKVAMFFHCQSGLVDEFRALYGDKLTFVGQRAIELRAGKRLPTAALKHCVALALTHHLRKQQGKMRAAMK